MFAVANTDFEWFSHIRSKPVGRIVNYWTPTPWALKGLSPGDRFYFMLKSPIRKIGGFGLFLRYAEMTSSSAWEEFGLGNGVGSREKLIGKINSYAEKRSSNYVPSADPKIGCVILSDTVTLENSSFFTPEECDVSFPRQIVKYKYFQGVDQLAPHTIVNATNNEPRLSNA